MSPQIISDLTYHIVLLPKVDPPLSAAMEREVKKLAGIELERVNAKLKGVKFTEDYHMFTVTASPDMSPLSIARQIGDNVSHSLCAMFKTLEGWSSLYHDGILIKTGSKIRKEKIEEFIELSLEGF